MSAPSRMRIYRSMPVKRFSRSDATADGFQGTVLDAEGSMHGTQRTIRAGKPVDPLPARQRRCGGPSHGRRHPPPPPLRCGAGTGPCAGCVHARHGGSARGRSCGSFTPNGPRRPHAWREGHPPLVHLLALHWCLRRASVLPQSTFERRAVPRDLRFPWHWMVG